MLPADISPQHDAIKAASALSVPVWYLSETPQGELGLQADAPLSAVQMFARFLSFCDSYSIIDSQCSIIFLTHIFFQTSEAREYSPAESDVALFLHTSGTTSLPKGVPLTHGNLMTSIRNVAATFDL